MPRFAPFHGLRYDEDIAPASEVVAPPYDVVDAAERERLADRSPYNAIHIELPDGEDATRYHRAAAILEEWLNEGVLRRDDVPAFYAYRMRFVDESGAARSTLGVIGALEIDVARSGSVLPHERTMPKPKGDRLDLLRATGINTSPIWGLSLARGLGATCAEAIAHHGGVTATDDDGVIHECSPITDPDVIAEIAALVGSTPVVIADGHHRYETAMFFQEEVRAGNGDTAGPHDLVMALVVELSPDELVVEPIHRLLSGLPAGFDLLGALRASFSITPGPTEPVALAHAGREHGALGLVTTDGNFLCTPRAELSAAASADLDSARLDAALRDFPTHEIAYQHGSQLAADAVESGRAQVAFLLRPATVAQIADTAHSGVRMPPKTTFFAPKPRTGFLYREAVARTTT